MICPWALTRDTAIIIYQTKYMHIYCRQRQQLIETIPAVHMIPVHVPSKGGGPYERLGWFKVEHSWIVVGSARLQVSNYATLMYTLIISADTDIIFIGLTMQFPTHKIIIKTNAAGKHLHIHKLQDTILQAVYALTTNPPKVRSIQPLRLHTGYTQLIAKLP